MLLHAKNGIIEIGGSAMEYIRFGSGSRVLVMLPGLGDALRTMNGTALPMALMYRRFCRDFTVYAFSRKTSLPEGCTTRDMARDQAAAMEILGIGAADILGVSMGGMIAQWLAIDHPEKVNKLILAVTAAGANPILEDSLAEWIDLAQRGEHSSFLDSNLRRIYSESYYRKNRWMVPLLGKLTKPKSYDRFFIQAESCLRHDAFGELGCIRAPTLVIGGARDQVLGGEASREIAGAIPGAGLKMYPQWGHGLYDEEKTFNSEVLRFLLEQ